MLWQEIFRKIFMYVLEALDIDLICMTVIGATDSIFHGIRAYEDLASHAGICSVGDTVKPTGFYNTIGSGHPFRIFGLSIGYQYSSTEYERALPRMFGEDQRCVGYGCL